MYVESIRVLCLFEYRGKLQVFQIVLKHHITPYRSILLQSHFINHPCLQLTQPHPIYLHPPLFTFLQLFLKTSYYRLFYPCNKTNDCPKKVGLKWGGVLAPPPFLIYFLLRSRQIKRAGARTCGQIYLNFYGVPVQQEETRHWRSCQ